MGKEVKDKDGDILEVDMKCANCGNIYHWTRTIWSDVPHEAKPLACPVCGSIEWEDTDE